MVPNRVETFSDEKEKISELIRKFSFGKERTLNVITMPYNTATIFFASIMDSISRGKRVLYITNEKEDNIEIVDYIKKNTSFRGYTYVRKGEIRAKSSLIISSHQNALELIDWFDLVIYDDIRALSRFNNCEIADMMLNKRKMDGKLICYSIEAIFQGEREVVLPISENNLPVVEPRVITTRIDVNKDIPYMIYEYLKWSMDLEKKVIIYAPNKEKVENVYAYLSYYKKRLSQNILKHTKDEQSVKTPLSFMKMKRAILVTDDWEEIKADYKNTHVMVYFADDKAYDYKKLVFFCGKAGKGTDFDRGEVILLTSEETDAIEKAKSITRSFNKEAWEKGLLRV